jgi:cytosine/adenosine deaminase-related metal-dependent hydrolase
MVHVAEGTDARCRGELQVLIEANLLRQNTVIVHGIGLAPEDGPLIAAARACVVWCPESNRHLYGATAPVAALRAAGVRLGLGSDSPVSGARDPLSNLAAARREAALPDPELIELATCASGEVARLPAGGFVPGAAADFLVVDSLERVLAGERAAVRLVTLAGRALYGERRLMEALTPAAAPLGVDGAERRLEAGLARRAASLLKGGALRGLPWIRGLSFD